MFGDDTAPEAARIKVCCGPRCGVAPDHRAIYEALDRAARDAAPAAACVLPVMCQGLCHGGVTVVWPRGDKTKIEDAREARRQTASALGTR